MASRLSGSLLQYPARMAFVCYVLAIAVGTLLLSQPFCGAAGRAPIGLLDAAFTATSAVCVTGLVVRPTGHDFSLAGQIVILLLIQLGGIGIMTVTTFAMLELGGSATIRHRALMAETLGARLAEDLRWVLRNVLAMVLACEAVGFLLLAARNAADLPWPAACWHALFHSISAFCNAGFALYDDSMVRYQGDVVVNLTIIGLIVVGGIGFPVALDLRRNLTLNVTASWQRFSLHTKLVLLGTGSLLLLGTVAVLLLEWGHSLAGMGLGRRLLVAAFQSTTARTAGFNTIGMNELSNATLCVIMLLMLVGASSCSTGGGFKVSTLMVLNLLVWSKFRGRRQVSAFRRTISDEAIDRALATVLAFGVAGLLVLTLLLAVEQAWLPAAGRRDRFLSTMFETVSALGTVGLSMGKTAELSPLGRALIILLMLAGRLGPISIFAALARTERREPIAYPKEDVLIG